MAAWQRTTRAETSAPAWYVRTKQSLLAILVALCAAEPTRAVGGCLAGAASATFLLWKLAGWVGQRGLSRLSESIANSSPSDPVAIDAGTSLPVITIFSNPLSGGGRSSAIAGALYSRLKKIRGSGAVTLIETEHAGHAADIVAGLPRGTGPRLLVCCGGDGTASEVVNACMDRADSAAFTADVTIAAVPTGTGNGLAASMECDGHCTLGANELVAAAAGGVLALAAGDAKGRARPLDVLQVTPHGIAGDGAAGGAGTAVRHGSMSVGWGALGDFCLWTESRLRWVTNPALREAAGALILIAKGRFAYRGAVEYTDADTGDVHTIQGPFFQVICCNTSHLATDAHVAPGAKPDDGVVHLCVMRACSTFRAVHTFVVVESARHLELPSVSLHRASSVRIFPKDVGDGGCFAVDGDVGDVGYGAIEVTVQRGAGGSISCAH